MSGPGWINEKMHNAKVVLSMSKKELIHYAVFVTALVALSACQSSSSPQANATEEQTTMENTVDYTGSWMTSCLTVNAQQSKTIRFELNDGGYLLERKHYDGQSCSLEEDPIFTETDVGTYVVNDAVDLPSGVIAHDVRLIVESRIRNGEQVDINDDQGYSDFLHRDGNTLIRAKSNPVGVAAVQFSEELDFSVVYYLQENQ